MIKKLSILEIFLLLLVLISFTWTRYNPNLSWPFALQLSTMNLLFSSGLTLAVLINIILLVKFIRTGVSPSARTQIGALGFYLLMTLKDLWLFVKWNYYVGDFYLITIILLAPIALAISRITLNLKK